MTKGNSDPYSGKIRLGKYDPWGTSSEQRQFEIEIIDGNVISVAFNFLGNETGKIGTGNQQWTVTYGPYDGIRSYNHTQDRESSYSASRETFTELFKSVAGEAENKVKALVDIGLMQEGQASFIHKIRTQITSGEFKRFPKKIEIRRDPIDAIVPERDDFPYETGGYPGVHPQPNGSGLKAWLRVLTHRDSGNSASR